MHEVIITAADVGRRLDKFLLAYLNSAPRSLIHKLLRKKRIKLNGKRAVGSELLAAGDAIAFHLSQDTINSCRAVVQAETPNVKHSPDPAFEIVYEDECLLIINKPAGIPSHGGMKGKSAHLLAQALDYLQQSGAYSHSDSFTPALCNRLDVNTSGLVVCGKNYQAIRAVNALFATENGVGKEYLAVVDGQLHGAATLHGFYRKDTVNNTAQVTSDANGVAVVTAYKSLAVTGTHSLIAVNPITGRSHQIRAHLAAVGHPLAGDRKYGGKPMPYAKAQLLHCRQLTLQKHERLPYTESMTWTADLPGNFKQCIADWFGIAM